MSGAGLAYHLRSHKAVDRRLFIDLLMRFERWRPIQDYVYFSMGAYPLEDHKLIHRMVGINRLVAFDYDEAVVARQKFNRPVESCVCLNKKSADVIQDLERILLECDFRDPPGVILWLDYTDPKQIGSQIREFQSLLEKLAVGDVVRVTVNASPNELLDADEVKGPLPITEKMRKQFASLQNRIGDFLPSSVAATDMTKDGLPRVLASSFGAAASRTLPPTSELCFLPLSIVRYADSNQMLSITGVVVKRSDTDDLKEAMGMSSWPFFSKTWDEVHELVVPALTLRERLFLERGIVSKSPEELVEELGFSKAANIDLLDFLVSYKKYYRFYPTMLPAEV